MRWIGPAYRNYRKDDIIRLEQRLLLIPRGVSEMRLVVLFAMSAALGISARNSNNIGVADAPPTELTIVLDFEGQHAEESIVEMKRETASILKPAGFLFDWRLR